MPRRSKSSKKAADTAAPERGAVAPDPRREGLLNCAAVAGPALACFALYLYTLAPTVVEDDSSEFVAAIHVLGIPHPTGYPLYMLLGRLFETLLPFGGAAYRINMLSAVCAALMVGLLGLLTFKITGSRPAAVLAAVASGLNQPTWAHAVVAEVYALHGLLVILVLLAFWRWYQKRTWRALSWLAAAAGFGLTHHRTILFFAAPTILIATVAQRPFRVRGLLKAIAAGVAPLALYAYLPVRAMANPWLNWGNPRTWDNFWFHITARTYAALPFGRSLTGALAEFWDFTREAAGEITWIGLLGAVVGAAVLSRRKPLFGLAIAACLAGVLIFNSTYGLPKQWQFHVPTFLGLGLWLGVALAAASEWVSDRWQASEAVRRAAQPIAYALAFALLPLYMATSNYPRCNRRGQWEVENWARRTVAELKQNAVLAATGDTRIFAIWYEQAVHRLRRDVTVVTPDGFSDPWYLSTVRDAAIRKAITEGLARPWPYVPDPQPSFSLHCTYQLTRYVPEHRALYAYEVPTELPADIAVLKHDPNLFEFVRLPRAQYGNERSIQDRAAERFLIPRTEKAKGVELLPGLVMVRAGIGERRVRRLETFPVEFGWICERPISPGFSVGLRLQRLPTPGTGGERYVAPSAAQEAPVVYGLPLSATPPGHEYRQKAVFGVDYQTMPGLYAVTVMVGKWDSKGRPVYRPRSEVAIQRIEVLPIP